MINMDKFANWFDLSSEEYREYVSGNGDVYRINNPMKFLPNKVSGTHYVLDITGVVHTLTASSFMVCRFYDRNGISFTMTSEGGTKHNG
jgi:hypothetical protein